MDEVIIEYQLTPAEGRRTQLGSSPKTNRSIVVIVVGFAIILAASTFGNHEPTFSIVLVVVEEICFALILVMRFWLAPRRYWRVTPGVREPRIVTFDDQGIVSKSDSLETRYEWSQFSGTRETEDFFFLLPIRGATGLAIPKRGLRSTEGMAILRLLLQSHTTVSSEDRLLRPGLARTLALLSSFVVLLTFIYVAARVG